MKLVQTAEIPQPPDLVWAFLMDIPRVARCVPGAGEVEAIDPDRWRGSLRVRVGPVGLNLQGTVVIVEQDPVARTAEMRVEAADGHIGGALSARLTMRLDPLDRPTPATGLTITTDAQIMGRIGDFGQPIMKRKADQIVREFAENIARTLSTETPRG